MKKIFKSFLLIGLVVLSGTLLVACGDKGESKAMKAAKEELTVEKILKDNTSKEEVKTDLNLVTAAGDATVTWSSDKVAVINVAGKVTRGNNDETVKLTANLKIGKETANKEFSVKVVKVENGTDPEPNPDPTPNPNPTLGNELLEYSFNFTSLAENTSYVTEATAFEVQNSIDAANSNFERLYTNISKESNSGLKGLVLGIRPKDNFPSPYVATKFQIAGLKKVEFKLFAWNNDVKFNFGWVENVVVEVSTDGSNWTVAKDITNEVKGDETAKEFNVSVGLESKGNYYVRLKINTKSNITDKQYSLRYILTEMKIYTDK